MNKNDIKLIKRLNSNYEKRFLIIGVFHGDEFQGEYFINSYLEKVGEIMPTKNEIFYIPRLNSSSNRKNPNGVDLNRNFPTKNWVLGENNDYFGGNKPNSEIETQFMVELLKNYKFDGIITIHSPYKVINYDGPARDFAAIVQKYVNYPITSDIGYPTPGSFGTYCGVERKIPTLTIEIDENEDIEKLNKDFSSLFNFLENEY